jgi:S1-C subfamily serine protease
MTMDADHEKLLDELRSLVNRVDPVPEEVTKFADAALGWRRLDAELAELLSDSALESATAAAAVRGGARARSLTFGSSELEIGLEVQSDGARVSILGQLSPAARATIQVQRDDGTSVATAEADELGRFRLELEGGGRIRLQVIRKNEAAVETSWIGV